MISQYYTVLQLAEKWAQELNKTIEEVVQFIRAEASYPHDSIKPPALLVYPVDLLTPTGEITQVSVARATKTIETATHENGQQSRKFSSILRTQKYNAAIDFFNSAKCPPVLDDETKEWLSLLAVRLEDFKQWCDDKDITFPHFWHEPTDSTTNSKKNIRTNPPSRKGTKGPLQKMILGAIQAHYDQKGYAVQSFQPFLNFLRCEFQKKPRPEYFSGIKAIRKPASDTGVCITLNAGASPDRSRKYTSDQFYDIKNHFTPAK